MIGTFALIGAGLLAMSVSRPETNTAMPGALLFGGGVLGVILVLLQKPPVTEVGVGEKGLSWVDFRGQLHQRL
jgi:hypothetical protein